MSSLINIDDLVRTRPSGREIVTRHRHRCAVSVVVSVKVKQQQRKRQLHLRKQYTMVKPFVRLETSLIPSRHGIQSLCRFLTRFVCLCCSKSTIERLLQ